MTRSPRYAARAALMAFTLVCAGAAAPLAAQQIQGTENSAAVSAPADAPAAAPATARNDAPALQAGPRVPTAMPRVEARFKNAGASSVVQDNVDVNHNYLVYILVVAVLVVLLIFLIKRA